MLSTAEQACWRSVRGSRYDRIITDEERGTLEDHLLDKYKIDSWRDTTTFPFASFPAQMQLYPRGEDDSAEVTISGVVEESGWDSLVVEVTRDGEYWKEERTNLEYSGPKGALFSLAQRSTPTRSSLGLKCRSERALVKSR